MRRRGSEEEDDSGKRKVKDAYKKTRGWKEKQSVTCFLNLKKRETFTETEKVMKTDRIMLSPRFALAYSLESTLISF